GGDPPADAGEPVPVVLVTLATRPTVAPLATLHISFANDGTTVTRDFEIPADEATFPKTLSVTAPGRSGELGVEVAASDASGAVVARGRGAVALDAAAQADLSLMLDPEDFVVNSRTPESQMLARNPELAGRQGTTHPDGTA